MGTYIYWQGQRFTTGKSGECPICGHRTVCRERHYMAPGHSDSIMRIRKEENLDPATEKNQL